MARIIVNTKPYEASHGHKPRQPRRAPESVWAFQIDQQQEPVLLYGAYHVTVQKAMALARYAITVLP